MWIIVVCENGYYSYTITAKSEIELAKLWNADQERFEKWKKTWGPKIEVRKTYQFYGKPTSTLTI